MIDMRNRFPFLLVLVALMVAGPSFGKDVRQKKLVNTVILMIGDGMGVSHMQTAIDESGSTLSMMRAAHVALVSTRSANSRTTDSAAAATAISSGYKTNNGCVGVDPSGQVKSPNIREIAMRNGYGTGVVVSVSVTHATPAGFLAHNISRKNDEAIAMDVMRSGVDVLIGCGEEFFDKRSDKLNLIDSLKKRRYDVTFSMKGLSDVKRIPSATFVTRDDILSMSRGKGDYLADATSKALSLLKNNCPQGFFLMVEGSTIDFEAHANKWKGVADDVIDFDHAVARAFDYADRNPGTLVLVTADHETGGLTLPHRNDDRNYMFSSKGHTASPVALMAYGAGAENFGGFIDNTDIIKLITKVWGLKDPVPAK